jgi:Tfp pilus assembly protein PilP
LVKTKKTVVRDLTDKNQSSSLNQNKSNSDDELKEYMEQRKLEQKSEIEQLRKEETNPAINFKFNQVKKDLNCGIGFVNPYKPIKQNSLGHSQSWRFKKQKKYNFYN